MEQQVYPRVEMQFLVNPTTRTMTATHAYFIQENWSCKILFKVEDGDYLYLFDPNDAEVMFKDELVSPTDPRFDMVMTDERVEQALNACMQAFDDFANDPEAQRKVLVASLVDYNHKPEYLN